MSENPEQEMVTVLADIGDVETYYSNVMRLVSNVNDFCFLFGVGGPVALDGNEMRVKPECMIHMSPAHAKSLYLLLRKQLHDYEANWGKLPVHPDIVSAYGEDV